MAGSAVFAPEVTQTSSLDTHCGQQPIPASLASSSYSSTSYGGGDSSLSSSPRHYPTELTDPILEEEGDETESDNFNEPVTPISGRQSQDLYSLQNHEIHQQDSNTGSSISSDGGAPVRPEPVVSAPAKTAPIIINTAATPPQPPKTPTARTTTSSTFVATAAASFTSGTTVTTFSGTALVDTVVSDAPTSPQGPGGQEPPPTLLSRRTTRVSTASFKRTMSNIFRRTNSDKAAFPLTDGAYDASDTSLADGLRKAPSRRWSMHRSSAAMQSTTPPSPGTPPLEMAVASHHQKNASTATASAAAEAALAAKATVPKEEDFLANHTKKNRASTGLSIHRAINFVTSGSAGRNNGNGNGNGNGGFKSDAELIRKKPIRRRASTIDYSKKGHVEPINKGEPWALPAEAGTGLKARRMSLSLPDDFTVDVGELHDEFEYLHKMGRHRKHLGKGATSKVTLMYRKGFPDELYAVKEFRGKSSSETREEYEKKVKSEYSIAKSLHHPNIVETFRLCTDHGRWNHVMEYCQEGDLFSLVEKKYLRGDDRAKDRQCLFKQLVQGLNYLHTNGIAHRDIKLENLLITSNSKLKITDFGVSEVFSGIHPGLREAGGQCGKNVDNEVRLCQPGICGSLPYISPEVVAAKEPYDPRKLDVWGAAVVMVHLIFGGAMWREAKLQGDDGRYASFVKGWDKWNARHKEGDGITDTDYPVVAAFDSCVNPPVLRRILLQMLNPDPHKRVTIDKVANARWMRSVECCQLDTYDDPSKYIDASKKSSTKMNGSKIFCHDHLPPRSHVPHSLPKMPGSTGY